MKNQLTFKKPTPLPTDTCGMVVKIIKYSSLFFVLSFLSACAGNPFYHDNLKKCTIIDIDRNELVVCIGNKDGAENGQVFSVYRYSIQKDDEAYDYAREYIGKLAIVSVVNDHFARAKVISGAIQKHDIAELEK